MGFSDNSIHDVVSAGLLPNGDFEQGPDESQMNNTRVMSPNAIPHWEISGFVEYIGSGHTQDDMMILPVPEGDRAVRLGNDAAIRQELCVTRQAYYSITFTAARSCAQAEALNVSVTPDSGVLPIQTVYTSSAAGTPTPGPSRPSTAPCGSPSTTPATRRTRRADPSSTSSPSRPSATLPITSRVVTGHDEEDYC